MRGQRRAWEKMALGTPVVAPVWLRLMLRWEAVSTEAAEKAVFESEGLTCLL